MLSNNNRSEENKLPSEAEDPIEHVTATTAAYTTADTIVHGMDHLNLSGQSRNTSKEADESLYTCYERVDDYAELLRLCDFWLHGVAMAAAGAFGLIGNALTLLVLPRAAAVCGAAESGRNFRRLLMSLAAVDSAVIVFFVGDISVCGQFLAEEPYWYRVSYPYLIHPVRNMTLTASVFVVVAISAERYRAICHPLKYRPRYSRFYICLSLLTTFWLEFPRFFEFKLIR